MPISDMSIVGNYYKAEISNKAIFKEYTKAKVGSRKHNGRVSPIQTEKDLFAENDFLVFLIFLLSYMQGQTQQ